MRQGTGLLEPEHHASRYTLCSSIVHPSMSKEFHMRVLTHGFNDDRSFGQQDISHQNNSLLH